MKMEIGDDKTSMKINRIARELREAVLVTIQAEIAIIFNFVSATSLVVYTDENIRIGKYPNN